MASGFSYAVYRNTAMAGGAVYLRPSSQVKNIIQASNINCTDNVAVKRLEDIYQEAVPYRYNSGMQMNSPRQGPACITHRR